MEGGHVTHPLRGMSRREGRAQLVPGSVTAVATLRCVAAWPGRSTVMTLQLRAQRPRRHRGPGTSQVPALAVLVSALRRDELGAHGRCSFVVVGIGTIRLVAAGLMMMMMMIVVAQGLGSRTLFCDCCGCGCGCHLLAVWSCGLSICSSTFVDYKRGLHHRRRTRAKSDGALER
jgi:hypothetical protein